MDKILDDVVSRLNEHQSDFPFTAMVLKHTLPVIILLEDHLQRNMPHPLYQYPQFVEEIETAVQHCLTELQKADGSREPAELFISKAPLYSRYHYIVTFL